VLIEVEDIRSDRFISHFPMSKELIDEYNKYIIEGRAKGNVKDEHAMYHNRLFGEETI